ncbi:hypothetical protein PVK06_018399 [Gossypium arboreum]|uniref:Uncharacterized protein n=1 Tax=Gossypium arboreum TaxID=29729 RepID=A0ABR0Q645_GOSAR|nr:hypothetical protein PVK06_018399 [Gossypium arboreum]
MFSSVRPCTLLEKVMEAFQHWNSGISWIHSQQRLLKGCPVTSTSTTGPAALSGDEPIGVGLDGLLLDGKIRGLSAGVVELEGISAETGGAPAGVIDGGELVGVNESGELEGVDAGGEAVGGEIDGLEEEGGVAAGGWICGGGVVVGDFAGGDDVFGELAGGDDVVGELAGGDAVVGELAGGDDEGDLEGAAVVGVDLGDGEGEFWA